jgi:hypothetical protein
MRFPLQLLLAAGVVALSGDLSAQRAQDGGRDRDATGGVATRTADQDAEKTIVASREDGAAATKRAAQAGDDAEAAAGRAAGAARDAADPAKRAAAQDAARGFEDEENKHRERMAKINRLRDLANKAGQTERLTALKELERKEGVRYEKARERLRDKLGKGAFDKADEKLAKGRKREAGSKADRNKALQEFARKNPERANQLKEKLKARGGKGRNAGKSAGADRGNAAGGDRGGKDAAGNRGGNEAAGGNRAGGASGGNRGGEKKEKGGGNRGGGGGGRDGR